MEDDKINYDALLTPVPDDENQRLQKFKKKVNNRQSKPMYVAIIGKQSDEALIATAGIKDALHARNSREWGKHFTGEELAERQKRIDAGLMPYECQYTRQDMIDFANKAIYDYIGSQGLLVNSNLKLPTEWIELNLPIVLD
jgi:hypothetical protein